MFEKVICTWVLAGMTELKLSQHVTTMPEGLESAEGLRAPADRCAGSPNVVTVENVAHRPALPLGRAGAGGQRDADRAAASPDIPPVADTGSRSRARAAAATVAITVGGVTSPPTTVKPLEVTG